MIYTILLCRKALLEDVYQRVQAVREVVLGLNEAGELKHEHEAEDHASIVISPVTALTLI